jgi:hypothetical protein
MAWLSRETSCVICKKPWPDAAHTKNNGMASKGPDSGCAPLCREHHAEYDAGRVVFEAKYSVSMQDEAAVHFAAYVITREV